MHQLDCAPAAATGDKSSFLSEAKTMATLDDLEKISECGTSRQAGPSLDTTVPTLHREVEASYGAPADHDAGRASAIGSDSKEATNEGINLATGPTGVPERVDYDFPDGGLQAWSVVIGVRDHSHFLPSLGLCDREIAVDLL